MKNKKKNKKTKLNKKKLLIYLLIGVILISIIVAVIFIILNNNKPENNTTPTIEKIDQMENYDYYLDDNATEYYKELYDELKSTLNNEIINEEEYAKIISKLFVTDLFTLDNKITSSDIGGLQFVYTDFKDDFINIAKNSLYSSVESNIYNDRNQELPIVSNIEINNITSSKFSYNGNEYNSYNVELNIIYQKDLGYPTNYKLTLIKNDKYYQVVSGE